MNLPHLFGILTYNWQLRQVFLSSNGSCGAPFFYVSVFVSIVVCIPNVRHTTVKVILKKEEEVFGAETLKNMNLTHVYAIRMYN